MYDTTRSENTSRHKINNDNKSDEWLFLFDFPADVPEETRIVFSSVVDW